MTEVSRRKILMALASTAASAAVAGVLVNRGKAPSGVTRGRGQRTSFGSVALLAWSRQALAPSAPANHHHRTDSTTPVPSAVHGAWTDAVEVDVEVHNGTRQPMKLSPGQFRMRVDGDGPTVSLYRADHAPGSVPPGSTTTLRISYLAPPRERPLSLEFDDAVAMTTMLLGRLDDEGARA